MIGASRAAYIPPEGMSAQVPHAAAAKEYGAGHAPSRDDNGPL